MQYFDASNPRCEERRLRSGFFTFFGNRIWENLSCAVWVDWLPKSKQDSFKPNGTLPFRTSKIIKSKEVRIDQKRSEKIRIHQNRFSQIRESSEYGMFKIQYKFSPDSLLVFPLVISSGDMRTFFHRKSRTVSSIESHACVYWDIAEKHPYLWLTKGDVSWKEM